MSLPAPCFVLRWTESSPAIGEIQDGHLKIISPPDQKRIVEVSPVVECEIRRGERFLAPLLIIPDEWKNTIVVPGSQKECKIVKSVCVQTWTAPGDLRHLFPHLQCLMYSHWLLLPYKQPPKGADVSCHETDLGRICFVYPPDRTEYEKTSAANNEKMCIMDIKEAFAKRKKGGKR